MYNMHLYSNWIRNKKFDRIYNMHTKAPTHTNQLGLIFVKMFL